MVNVLLCSLMRISFCEGQVDINWVIQNTWKSQELSLRFDPQVSWVPVQHLESVCLYKDLSWGNTIIYPKSNAPALRIPQMFNHSDGSSQGLRLILKQVLKKRKKWTIKWNCPRNIQSFTKVVFLQESKEFKGEEENWFNMHLKANT